MMSAPHHLSWQNFHATVMVPGENRVHRVTASPRIEIFADGQRNRVGISIETNSDETIPVELSRLTFIEARTVVREKKAFLDVSTSVKGLYRQFYHFAVAVSERMLAEHISAVDAVVLELIVFTDLLAEKALLSIERQIGMIGELLFLELLLERKGTIALASWLGPMGEPHDFRINDREFEVKATVSTKRIHTIHGLEQMIPSKGCALALVSIVLGPPGAGPGFSLSSMVDRVSAKFEAHATAHTMFSRTLARLGYTPVDREHYTREFVLRRPLGIAPVDERMPALTRAMMQQVLGTQAARIDTVRYDLNIEGLEVEEGTARFEAMISQPTPIRE